ncbi:MAG: hypothetical protein K6U02_07405 [Firmicutes bacterium]|nr:hypothetical protein [Bacillota bacterium]
MEEIAASKPAWAVVAGGYDHRFYTGMALAMAVVVFVGFAPPFYLRVFNGPAVTISGAPLSPLVYFHGALFTAWMVLFILQTSLVAMRRTDIHRMGVVGAVLAGVMVVVGSMTAIAAAARGSAPPGIAPLVFLVVPLFDMGVFALLVAAAMWLRRKKEARKRLMLLATINLMAAPVARLPGMLPLGLALVLWLAFLFLVVGVVFDLTTRRRVHLAYIWGGLVSLASVPLRLVISGTDTWRSFAEFLTQ